MRFRLRLLTPCVREPGSAPNGFPGLKSSAVVSHAPFLKLFMSGFAEESIPNQPAHSVNPSGRGAEFDQSGENEWI